MKIEVNGNALEFYDSIKELPILRKHEFEKTILMLSGVGSNLMDYDVHFNRVILFIDKGNESQAKQELLNQRQQYFLLISNFSIECLAFVWLIKGCEISSIEEAKEKHNELLKMGITSEQVESVISNVKKNYFPN